MNSWLRIFARTTCSDVSACFTRRFFSGSIAFKRWKNVEMGPKDPIFGVTESFRADTSPKKINLGVGAYRDDNGKPVVLSSVQKASQLIVDENMDHEYAPVQGLEDFIAHSLTLAHGEDCSPITEKRVAAVQSLSGTGALRILGEFIKRFAPGKTPNIYIPNPSWGNHIPIFVDSGLAVKQYSYYDPKSKGLDLNGMLKDLNEMEDNQVILLHASAHNPTGVDPTLEQWSQISKACMNKGHFVIFDMAYQGFASGSAEADAASVRLFVEDGHDVALAQSFSKNFGLYGQRVGCASMLVANPDEALRVQSQMKILARAIYSNPPLHGARIVSIVLSDSQLKKEWYSEVDVMAKRIISMRVQLRKALEQLNSPHNWQHITKQIGMFCYSGLSAQQVDALSSDHHIYLTRNGRISMVGLTTKHIEYVANCIHQVSSTTHS